MIHLRPAFAAVAYCLLIHPAQAQKALPAPASSLKAGFAYADITPDIGAEQPGGYGKSFHKTFHDACKVRAAVFDDGKKRAAVVGLDVLGVPREVVLAARAGVQKECGIDPGAVMISASHSHSSGPVGMVQPGEYDGASEVVQRLAYQESSLADRGFLSRLTLAIVQAVQQADAGRVPVELGYGFGHEDKVSFNRRLRMKNGETWSHPGAGNPDIVEYAGPIDPQVGVIGAWDLHGNLVGCVVNFACHATTSPGGISANWPCYLEKTIQGALDTHAPVIFVQGACGDITQVDNLSPYRRPSGEDWAKQVGGRVGAEAVKALLVMPRAPEAVIDSRQKTWNIKRRVPSPEKVAKAKETIAAGPPKGDPTDYTFAKETLMLDHLISVHPEVEHEVQTIQVGPAVFVSNPAEYFVQYGLDIKKASPFAFTFPVELANGCAGYVPTEEAFGPHGGGYETRLTSYSNLEVSAGRQFADAGLELAKSMTPGPVPVLPKIPFGGRAWTYGNRGPELR
ncbi:MAG: hypothetical protein JWO94_3961 [Verrucomicrobiaceae bacterium]|nr:hypothetical protein [Verrucomicrobiaceae bacterium]